MTEIKGLAGAPGLIEGKAVVLRRGKLSTEKSTVRNPQAEADAMEAGRHRYNESLRGLATEARIAHGDEGAAIFEAYQEIIQDDVFFAQVKDIILQESVCASYAIDKKRADVEAIFAAVDDEYLKARAVDINNVCRELMAGLQGISLGDPFADANGNELVIFAEDLTPSDTVRLDRTRLKGMVTERGGVTSHTVILAKALGIPAIVGCGPILDKIASGVSVLVDGTVGVVIAAPDEMTKANFYELQQKSNFKTARFDACRTKPAVTRDGVTVRVNINSGDKESIKSFEVNGCDGVGLFRTEFIYMDQPEYPSEDLQFEVYKDMSKRTSGKELIIRTLDIGGDKQLDYMDMPVESNPFLGYRAIRLCLDRTEVFKTQLRAILRASVYGNVKIMFPMIVNLEELLRAKELVTECMKELDASGIPFARDIKIGIMIETPAAVLISDILAKHVDFFSIGSNDLIQYTTATDRMNEKVQYLYDSYNISVLRSIKMVCDNAKANNIEVGICGEVASEPRLIPLWCMMGIDELSVAPSLVGRTKYIVTQLSKSSIMNKMDIVLSSGKISDAKNILDDILEELGI